MKKLVRTKIPEIIQKSGRDVVSVTVTGEDLKLLLADKLIEEANELASALRNNEENYNVVGEIVDITDVIDSIQSLLRISTYSIDGLRSTKNECRGGFLNTVHNSNGAMNLVSITYEGIYISEITEKDKK